MSFWIVAVLGLFVALAWLLRPLFRASASAKRRASYDMQVYRDQLAEVESDLARGVLGESEAKASRTEVSRRLLAAASEEEQETASSVAPRGASIALALGAAVLVLFTSVGIYTFVGAPGYPDRPLSVRRAEDAEARANRPTQAQAEKLMPEDAAAPNADPRLADLVRQLEEALENRGDDLQGYVLLADNLGRLGRFADAYAAQETVIRLKGDAVTGNDHAQMAEFMILAAGGYISPEAEKHLTIALQSDPKNILGRYYSAIVLAQGNRPDLGLRLWEGLLVEGPEDAPWIALIHEQIGEMAARAGLPVPDAALQRGPSPSAGDIEAVAAMTPEDREKMIRTMVSGLAERLNSEGGTLQEWTRLIRAYGVLGEIKLASNTWKKANETFAEDSSALAQLRSAARDAKVTR